MKLYYSENLNPRVAVAVARYLNSPLEFIRASPRDPDEEEAFRTINPNTLVPVLVEGEGENQTRLWEADAIACRLSSLAQSDFWPGANDLTELIMWLSWSAYHFVPAGEVYYVENIIGPRYFDQTPDQDRLNKAAGEFHRYAKVLGDTLATRRWLINNRVSYADFRAASVLPFAQEAKLPLEGYRHIQEWVDRLNQIDSWRAPFDGL